MTSGQYDGDGMWMWCGSGATSSSSVSTAAPAGSRSSRPSSSSVYFRCQNSSRWVTSGISAKLYSGGGDEVDHSSVRASHGSGPAIGPRRSEKIDVDEEQQHRRGDDERPDGRHQVQRVPAQAVRVRVRAAGLPLEPEEVHREEGQVEPDQQQPEHRLGERLVQHAAEELREPVVQPAEHREHQAAEQHVVEVRDDEVRVVLLRVGRHDRAA